MTPLSWVLLAAAAQAWPSGDRGSPSPYRVGRRPVVGAVFALLVLCVGVLGPTGLAVAAVLCPAAAVAVPRLPDRRRATRPTPATALTLDLAAAALRAGRPLPDALRLAAPAADAPLGEALRRTAHLLELGADPVDAWADGSALLAPVAEVAVRSHSSGVRLAAAFERLAADLRAARATAALARAQRAGVHAMGPLAACFLPSFVCLGIVPVVAGVAASVVGSLR